MDKKKKEKRTIYILLVILLLIIVYIIYSFLTLEGSMYNYDHIYGSYTAQDGSYLVLNKDKTFYWYMDKDDKDNYYFGTYTVFRGEKAVDYLTTELSIYGISEEEQRQTIDNIDIKNAIDHYYLINLMNDKVVVDGKENKIFKETRYYGFATHNYNEFDLLNVDANNYAVFMRDR